MAEKECGLNKSERKCPGTVSEEFCPIGNKKCPKNSNGGGGLSLAALFGIRFILPS